MNYLKNRYPFKLLTNIFRLATRSTDTLQSSVEIKRNKSDSILKIGGSSSSQELLSKHLKKNTPESAPECQNIQGSSSGHKLTLADSFNSLPLSKTSSEHSFGGVLDRKRATLVMNSENSSDSLKKLKASNLDHELKSKLKKLRASLNPSKEYVWDEEGRSGLKRAYPWQNFNLDSISQSDLDKDPPKKSARNTISETNIIKSSSNQSMVTMSNSTLSLSSSNPSLISFNSGSSASLDEKTPRYSLQEIKDQMPLFKSILRKSARKSKLGKEVTFNNISTIYKSRSNSYLRARHEETDKQRSRSNYSLVKQANLPLKSPLKGGNEPLRKIPAGASYLGRYEPLKAEHSFMHLYTSKNPKN